MIGIDSNVLLRFILADDPVQFAIARTFLAKRTMADPAFVSLLVFAETCWVLRRRYKYGNDVIAGTFRQLLTAEELVFEDEHYLDELVAEDASLNFDLSDHLVAHMAARSGCTKTMTFDAKAAGRIPGMEFLI
jgi:predicted nucleic-acid-binding protein